jgi:hypothetical protein
LAAGVYLSEALDPLPVSHCINTLFIQRGGGGG